MWACAHGFVRFIRTSLLTSDANSVNSDNHCLLTGKISSDNLPQMDIKSYLKKRHLSQKAFGDLIGVSQARVSQWLSGDRIDGEWAVKIEKKTGGAIQREDVRPDLYRREAA